MTTYLALLRAVNVGGHGMVAMSELRALLTEIGYTDARSLLQSGNVVFRGAKKAAATVERQLEAEIEQRFHFSTTVFVRTATEWDQVIVQNPFPAEATRDPGRLLLLALKDAGAVSHVAALQTAITGPELVRAGAGHAYAVYPNGAGRSKLTTALIEKRLGTRVTARNWNTVLKLQALLSA